MTTFDYIQCEDLYDEDMLDAMFVAYAEDFDEEFGDIEDFDEFFDDCGYAYDDYEMGYNPYMGCYDYDC